MKDIILDTLLDTLKLIPFLFVAFLIIELIEHKFSKKTKTAISKSGRFGPIIGALLGAIPQCGFSVIATNFYVTRIVTLGTLISIYLATSDEMIPIMLSHNVALIEILKIVSLKVVIGFSVGLIIDLIYHPQTKKDFGICEHDDCDCEESLFKATVMHTLKTICFIMIASFILNLTFFYIDEAVITNIFKNSAIFSSFFSSLIGLIPNCGASVMITELYVKGVISFGSLMAGLLTGSGVAIMVLFKENKNLKENFSILALIYFIGAIAGIIINLIGGLK